MKFSINSWLKILQNEEKFPLSVIPHLALFLNGEKIALRLIVSNKVLSQIVELCDELQLNYAISCIKIEALSESWNSFDFCDTTISTHNLIAISKDNFIANEIKYSELSGDYIKSGKLLGYPECCINSYLNVSDNVENWSYKLLKISNFKISPWCNRIASMWGGCCSSGELFPCSLTCKNAIKYGKQADLAMRNLGISKIADLILSQAQKKLYLSNQVIELEKIKNSINQDITILGI